jgi:hypothetical protein
MENNIWSNSFGISEPTSAPAIESLPYRVEPEPMSLADTFNALHTPDDVRKLVTGSGVVSMADRVWLEASSRANAAGRDARAEEDRFNELVALHGQRCRERENAARRLSASLALEEPATVAQMFTMETVYDRIIADLLNLIEQQRAIAMKAKVYAARADAIDKLASAAIRSAAPPAELAKVFGVSDPLDLSPPLVRSRVRQKRAQVLADEERRKADAERADIIAKQRTEEEAAQLQAEKARIDKMSLEEIAETFFKGEPLRLVRAAITKGLGDQEGTQGMWQIEGLASQDVLYLSPGREYALDALLKHFYCSTIQERANKRREIEASRTAPEPLTVESIATSDDWRALLEVSGMDQREVMNHYFLNGCTDGRGQHLLQHAIETKSSRAPLAAAAILRLNELAQNIRIQATTSAQAAQGRK